jgi:hypothetical protein
VLFDVGSELIMGIGSRTQRPSLLDVVLMAISLPQARSRLLFSDWDNPQAASFPALSSLFFSDLPVNLLTPMRSPGGLHQIAR